MGWWKADDGIGAIGDGPADALSLALGARIARDGAPVRLEDVLAAFLHALALNPEALLADPAALQDAGLKVRLADGSLLHVAPAPESHDPQSTEELYAAIEEAAALYRDAYDRKPSIAELLETLAFVLRAYDEIVTPDAAAIDTLTLDAVRPAKPTDPATIMIVLPTGTMAGDVGAATAVAAGFTRDPDRTDVSIPGSRRTFFASWTGGEGDDREIDFHFDPDVNSAWLELRGKRTDELAASLCRELGGRIGPTLEAALAELLTPPPGPSVSPTGLLRWKTLQAAIAAGGTGGNPALRALIAAGLRDPDWRVRMTAVLATGRLRLAEFAAAAMAAKVPDAGTSDLGQEDRRTLLALRHAAHNLALGRDAADGIIAEPEMRDRRVGYQQLLRGLIDAPQAAVSDRASAFVMVLFGGSHAANATLPDNWRRWTHG